MAGRLRDRPQLTASKLTCAEGPRGTVCTKIIGNLWLEKVQFALSVIISHLKGALDNSSSDWPFINHQGIIQHPKIANTYNA